MSIFSKIKSSKQAAQKHKAVKASTPEVQAPAPYRHVPTHAAVDALSGAPAGWKAEDRPAIQEANRKRMSRSESNLSMPMYAPSNRLIRNNSSNSADGNLAPSAVPNFSMNKRNSSSVSYPPRPIHLGYMAYDGYNQAQFGRAHSQPGKSPLSSQRKSSLVIYTLLHILSILAMTPADSQSVASSSSSGMPMFVPATYRY